MSAPGKRTPGLENHREGDKWEKDAHAAGTESGWGGVIEITGILGTKRGLWL